MLRVVAGAHVVVIAGQPMFAGVYLSGDYDELPVPTVVHLHGGRTPAESAPVRPGPLRRHHPGCGSSSPTSTTRFDGYRGRYLLHCHNAEHEDRGMMANLEVT